jgi:hypothetical protein
MAIVRKVDETGPGAFYDVPRSELPKYKLVARPFDSLSDEDMKRLLNGVSESCFTYFQDPATGEWMFVEDDPC